MVTQLIGLFIASVLGGASPAEPPHHPHDIVAAIGISPDFPEDPRLFVASPGTMNLFLVSTDFGVTFRPSRTGVRGTVFRDIGFASDWSESGVMYLVTEDGGLQQSNDRGESWQPPLLNTRLRHIAVAPVAEDGSRVLFCASKEAVHASFDGGATFRVVFEAEDTHIESLAVSPQFGADQTVFVGLADGHLARSSDAGKAWATTKLAVGVTNISLSPEFASDGKLWVATWGAGVQRSDDGGATFSECWDGLTDFEVNKVRIAPGTSCQELFACTRKDGVFHSVDGGDSWAKTSLQVEKTAQTENHYTSLLISPDWPRDRRVICGTFEGLQVSQDAGASWRESNINPSRIGRILAVSDQYETDQTLFGAGYGMQLLVSKDGAESWDLSFTKINAMSVYSIAPCPDFEKHKIMLLGATRGVRASRDGCETWEFIKFPDMPNDNRRNWYTTRAVTYSPGFPDDQRVYVTTTLGRIYRSDDLGVSWAPIIDKELWTTGIALSPDFVEDKTMYVSGSGVFVSKDAGMTFEGPLYPWHMLGNNLVCAPDFSRSRELYAIARYQGFVIGHRGGEVWQQRNDGLDGFAPMALRLSPAFVKDKTMFVLTSGGGLYRSQDRGRSWARISERGGPLDQAFTLAVSPNFANDKTLFAGTFSGIMKSVDGGVTWSDTLRTEFYDDERDPWSWRGAWKPRYEGRPYGISVRESRSVDDMAVLDFDGVGCRLIGATGPQQGIAEILMDDRVVATIDQYSAVKQDQRVMYEVDGLPLGAHRLVVRVTGKKSEAATDCRVKVDAAFVHYR